MATAAGKTYCITKGDRFEIRITLTRPNGSAFDLVEQDLTAPKMELRSNVTDPSPAATFTASIVGKNTVILVLDATVTLGLSVGRYHGRLLLQHASDPTLDQITGTKYAFTVEESATRR